MATSLSTPLSLLLDLSSLENSTQISLRFREIAETLLHDFCLRIEHQGVTTEFELLEVEFYLQKQDVHEDPFCHAHEDQQISAQWYFHRVPKRSSSSPPIKTSVTPTAAHGYRGGTRKGLDLTFGTPIASSFFPTKPSSACRGGILLRTMRRCDGDAAVISGPSLLVDQILSLTGSRNVSELITSKLGGYASALPPSSDSSAWSGHPSRMYLTPRQRDPSALLPSIHQSPRVGLDLSHPSVSAQVNNPRVVYLAKLYRYFVRPELLKANGRCHTLVGLCLEVVSDTVDHPLNHKPALVEPLAASMAIPKATLEKYLEDYADGFKNKSLADYVGALGKGVSSTPRLFMRLMGVMGRMALLKAPPAEL